MPGPELTTDFTKPLSKNYSGGRCKTLFFIPSLDGGGAEKVMVEILRNIGRERIEPVLVLLYPFEDSPYKYRLPKDIDVIVVQRTSDSFFAKIRQYLRFVKTVLKENPDVIMSMLTHTNIMAVSAGLIAMKKVVISEHTALTEMIRKGQGKRMLSLTTSVLVKIFYRFADSIIAVSEGVGADLKEGFGVPAGKIKLLHNPLDLKRISELCKAPAQHDFFKDGVPVIVSAGRLVTEKGFDILLKAFRDVIRKMDARLIVLGEGPERQTLSRLADELAIADKVSFPGFQKDPYNFISSSDVFVLSSRYEGLPMVILEAMACGTPVISTDCNYGPEEILKHGDCGVLVANEDSHALSTAIQNLLVDRAQRARFSASGRTRANDFSRDKIVRRYEEVILRSCHSRNGKALSA